MISFFKVIMSIETREVFSEIEIITARFILDMCQLYEVQHFKNPEKESQKKGLGPMGSKYLSHFMDKKMSANKQKLLMESMFLRMFVVFERFISEIIEKSTQIKEVANIFQDKFQKACLEEREIQGKNWGTWDSLYNKPLEELLENKNLLMGRENPVKFASDLFGLGTIEKKENINSYYFVYLEGKERRNCLTHNGIKPSGSYNKQIEKYRKQYKQSNFSKIIDEENYKFLVPLFDEDVREVVDQNPNDIKDLAVSSFYFNLIFIKIIYLSTYLVCGFKKKHFPEEEYNFGFLHDLLTICEDYSVQEISLLYIELKKIFGIKNFSTLSDEFNSLLMQNIEFKNSEEILKQALNIFESRGDSEKLKQVKENLKDCKRRKKIQINALKNKLFFSSEQISEEIKKSPYEKEDLNNLLLAHLQNKDEDMVSVANSIIKNLLKNDPEEPPLIYPWAVFHKFKKKKYFVENVTKDFWVPRKTKSS